MKGSFITLKVLLVLWESINRKVLLSRLKIVLTRKKLLSFIRPISPGIASIAFVNTNKSYILSYSDSLGKFISCYCSLNAVTRLSVASRYTAAPKSEWVYSANRRLNSTKDSSITTSHCQVTVWFLSLCPDFKNQNHHAFELSIKKNPWHWLTKASAFATTFAIIL